MTEQCELIHEHQKIKSLNFKKIVFFTSKTIHNF